MMPYIALAKRFWFGLTLWFWNIAHNAVAHPLIPFLPEAIWKPFHDWTAYRWARAETLHKEYLYTWDSYSA